MGVQLKLRKGKGAAALRGAVPARLRPPLARAGWRAYERYLALRGRRAVAAPDGLPVPPARLRVLVSGTADGPYFLSTGKAEAIAIKALLQTHGRDAEALGSILDFGCGCGRVARHVGGGAPTQIYGCDYNDELVRWCQSNLPFMTARVNNLAPPLPFETSFDLIYAISVFTHLAEELQYAWIVECRERLKPGGWMLFTTQGARYRDRLSPAERKRFDRGELVTRFDEVEGANLCSTYHPPQFVRAMLDGFELIESIETGLPGVGSPTPLRMHDVHLAART